MISLRLIHEITEGKNDTEVNRKDMTKGVNNNLSQRETSESVRMHKVQRDTLAYYVLCSHTLHMQMHV